jgi:GrpB-like predicted nucleotidyltransferase (UPF0157 family)
VPAHISGTGDHQIHPYDPRWPEVAAQVAAKLRRVLTGIAVRIDHIGSTAVADLAARPIPDLQVSVADITDRDRFAVPLVAAGYEHFVFPELLVDDYFVFVPADGSNTEHIQICEAGSHQEQRHLAVRDYLRSHTWATIRPPALLIKTVTTLDVLSGGRAWLGVGAGYQADEAPSPDTTESSRRRAYRPRSHHRPRPTPRLRGVGRRVAWRAGPT